MRSSTILFIASKSSAACLISVSLKSCVWRNMEEHADLCSCEPPIKDGHVQDVVFLSVLNLPLHLPHLSHTLRFWALTSVMSFTGVRYDQSARFQALLLVLLSLFTTPSVLLCFTSCLETTVDGCTHGLCVFNAVCVCAVNLPHHNHSIGGSVLNVPGASFVCWVECEWEAVMEERGNVSRCFWPQPAWRKLWWTRSQL